MQYDKFIVPNRESDTVGHKADTLKLNRCGCGVVVPIKVPGKLGILLDITTQPLKGIGKGGAGNP